MNIGTEIKSLPDDIGKTAEELGIITDNNFEVSKATLDAADQLSLMQNQNAFFSIKTVENSEWYKAEINKAYDRGYQTGKRNKKAHKSGRNQGMSDAKQDIKNFLKGTRSCQWLGDLLTKHNLELRDIKK